MQIAGNVISLRDLHNACLLVDFLQSIDSVFYKINVHCLMITIYHFLLPSFALCTIVFLSFFLFLSVM